MDLSFSQRGQDFGNAFINYLIKFSLLQLIRSSENVESFVFVAVIMQCLWVANICMFRGYLISSVASSISYIDTKQKLVYTFVGM